MNTYSSSISLSRFLEIVLEDQFFFMIKRLSGNDTGINKTHQAGIYAPRWFFEHAFPTICSREIKDPRTSITDIHFINADTHIKNVQAIYYNSKFHPYLGLKKAYNEFRLTGWGGRASCPFQEPANTGALALFGIKKCDDAYQGIAWVCTSEEEEELMESWIGYDVLPGEIIGPPHIERKRITKKSLSLAEKIIQPDWKTEFPSGAELFRHVAQAIPNTNSSTYDDLLLARRKLEFAIFALIEEMHVLPRISKGFESVDDFINFSLSVANRRKSRTGRSLELNLAQIFHDARLQFDEQATTEQKKKPDFLFPSQKAYHDLNFPATSLDMLAAKTCCKDRWRQIINEADRIDEKHLFTLQQGVSIHQFREMQAHRIKVVTVESNRNKFPESIRDELMNLDLFVNIIRCKQN